MQWPGTTELVNLTRNFNRMAESLDLLERERREMIADIAHESCEPRWPWRRPASTPSRTEGWNPPRRNWRWSRCKSGC